MTTSTVYFIKPPPDGDYLIKLAQRLSKDGYNLSYTDKEIFLITELKHVLLEKGATAILSQQLLTEEFLPDSAPRNTVLDTLRYKLNRCSPKQSLHIIDPYLYPSNNDADYVTDFISIFEDSLKSCSVLHIATLQNRNMYLEQQINNVINKINPNLSITIKYTNVFHDRF